MLVHGRTSDADLIVITQVDTKIFPGYFPPNSNNSYVEVDLLMSGNSQLIVFKNGAMLSDNPVNMGTADDANFVYIQTPLI